MPRNGSSVYSLPAGNPVVSGTVIATTWANTTLTDIATALTNSLSTDGSTASVSLAGKTMAGGTFNSPTVTSALTLTGGQIAFPAVQVPSAGANVLDDYEEGTWTPVLSFATPGDVSVAYTTRIGTYTKIGQLNYAKVIVVTSTFTHTTSSGGITITGWPFAPQASGAQGVPSNGVLYSGFNLGATVCGVIGRLTVSPTMSFMGMTTGSPGAFTDLSSANHTTGTNISLYTSANYEVA